MVKFNWNCEIQLKWNGIKSKILRRTSDTLPSALPAAPTSFINFRSIFFAFWTVLLWILRVLDWIYFKLVFFWNRLSHKIFERKRISFLPFMHLKHAKVLSPFWTLRQKGLLASSSFYPFWSLLILLLHSDCSSIVGLFTQIIQSLRIQKTF